MSTYICYHCRGNFNGVGIYLSSTAYSSYQGVFCPQCSTYIQQEAQHRQNDERREADRKIQDDRQREEDYRRQRERDKDRQREEEYERQRKEEDRRQNYHSIQQPVYTPGMTPSQDTALQNLAGVLAKHVEKVVDNHSSNLAQKYVTLQQEHEKLQEKFKHRENDFWRLTYTINENNERIRDLTRALHDSDHYKEMMATKQLEETEKYKKYYLMMQNEANIQKNKVKELEDQLAEKNKQIESETYKNKSLTFEIEKIKKSVAYKFVKIFD